MQPQLLEGTPSAGNVIVDGTDSVTQESCQSSTDSTDMSEEEEGSDTLPGQVSGETHIDETAQFAEYFALEGSSYHEECQKVNAQVQATSIAKRKHKFTGDSQSLPTSGIRIRL